MKLRLASVRKAGLILVLLVIWSWGLPGVRPLAQSEVSFRDARRDFGVGVRPWSVAAGDFNGDAALDLAVVNRESNDVSILLGRGDGTFRPAQSVAVGRDPRAVVVGDFDGNGVPDLAVANFGSDTISILLGNGDGTFRPAPPVEGVYDPSAVALGDFDGDARQDLAVANRWSNTVSIHLGNGDGTFRPAQHLRAGSGPVAIAVGDFDGDDVADLAAVDSGGVLILLGQGDGTFRSAGSSAIGANPNCVAVGDFNGDNLPDLAVGSLGIVRPEFLSIPGSISILLGNGDGTFRPLDRMPRIGRSMMVADFNGDDIPDLIVASGSTFLSPALGPVSLFFGRGDGTFGPPQDFAAGLGPSSVAVGDYNGDEIPDVAVTNTDETCCPNPASSVSVLLGNGDGMLRSPPTFAAGRGSASVAVADLDGDALPDLAVTNGQSNDVSILLGQGDGAFGPARHFPVGGSPGSVTVGDFNGDKVLDLAVTTRDGCCPDYPGTVAILLGQGGGAFGPARHFSAGRGPTALAVGDFDGDKIPDLAVANFHSNNVSILLGLGDGTFRLPQNLAVGGSATSVAIGDFDGDAIPDLAVANQVWSCCSFPPGTVSIFLGNGDGTFRLGRNFDVVRDPHSLITSDLDGDAIPDLAVVSWSAHAVSVLFGNGDGTFRPARNLEVRSNPNSVTVGDFNGDGMPDLAVANDRSNNIAILLGQGDGTFGPPQLFGVGSGPRSITVGDFNGDGRPDLVVAIGSNDVSILINETLPPGALFGHLQK